MSAVNHRSRMTSSGVQYARLPVTTRSTSADPGSYCKMWKDRSTPPPIVPLRPSKPSPAIPLRPSSPSPAIPLRTPSPSPAIPLRPPSPSPAIPLRPPSPYPAIPLRPPSPSPAISLRHPTPCSAIPLRTPTKSSAIPLRPSTPSPALTLRASLQKTTPTEDNQRPRSPISPSPHEYSNLKPMDKSTRLGDESVRDACCTRISITTNDLRLGSVTVTSLPVISDVVDECVDKTTAERKGRSLIPKPIAKRQASVSRPLTMTSPEAVSVSTVAIAMFNDGLGLSAKSTGMVLNSDSTMLLEAPSSDSMPYHEAPSCVELVLNSSSLHNTADEQSICVKPSSAVTENASDGQKSSLAIQNESVTPLEEIAYIQSTSASLATSDLGAETSHNELNYSPDDCDGATADTVDDCRRKDAKILHPSISVVMTTSCNTADNKLNIERFLMTSSVDFATSEMNGDTRKHVTVFDHQQETHEIPIDQTDNTPKQDHSTNPTGAVSSVESTENDVDNGFPEIAKQSPTPTSSSSRCDHFYPVIIDSVAAKMKPEIVDWIINNSKIENRKSSLSRDSSDSGTSLATISTDLGVGVDDNDQTILRLSPSGNHGHSATSGCLVTTDKADADSEKERFDARFIVRLPLMRWAASAGSHVTTHTNVLASYINATVEDHGHVVVNESHEVEKVCHVIENKSHVIEDECHVIEKKSRVIIQNNSVVSSCETFLTPLTEEQLTFGATVSTGSSFDGSRVKDGNSFGISNINIVDAAPSAETPPSEQMTSEPIIQPRYIEELSHVTTGNTLGCRETASSFSVQMMSLCETDETGCRENQSLVKNTSSLHGVAHLSTIDIKPLSPIISATVQNDDSACILMDSCIRVAQNVTSSSPVDEGLKSAAAVPPGGIAETRRRLLLSPPDVTSGKKDSACSGGALMATCFLMTSQSPTADDRYGLPLPINEGIRLSSTEMTSKSTSAPEMPLLSAQVIDAIEESRKGTRSRTSSKRKVIRIERIPSLTTAQCGRSTSTILDSIGSSSYCPLSDTSSYSFKYATQINQSTNSTMSRDRTGCLCRRRVKWPQKYLLNTPSEAPPMKQNTAVGAVGESTDVVSEVTSGHVTDRRRPHQRHTTIRPGRSVSSSRVALGGPSLLGGRSRQVTLPHQFRTCDERLMKTSVHTAKKIPIRRQRRTKPPPVHPVPTRSSALRELLHSKVGLQHHHGRRHDVPVCSTARLRLQHKPETHIYNRRDSSTPNTTRHISPYGLETGRIHASGHRSTSVPAPSKRTTVSPYSPRTWTCSRSRHPYPSDRAGRSSPSPPRRRSESTGARFFTKSPTPLQPIPTRTSEMRRALSRMVPRTIGLTPTTVDIGGRLNQARGHYSSNSRQRQHTMVASSVYSTRHRNQVRTVTATNVEDQYQDGQFHHHHHHHHYHPHVQQSYQRHSQQYHRQRGENLRHLPLSSTRSHNHSRDHQDSDTSLKFPISKSVQHRTSLTRSSHRRPIARTFLIEDSPVFESTTSGYRSMNSSPRRRQHLWLCSQERSTTVRYTSTCRSTASDATGSSRWPGDERDSWTRIAATHPEMNNASHRPASDFTTSSSTISSKSRRTRSDKLEHSVSIHDNRPGNNSQYVTSGNNSLNNRTRTLCAGSPPPPPVSPQRVNSAKLRRRLGLQAPRPNRPIDIVSATTASATARRYTRGEPHPESTSLMSNEQTGDSDNRWPVQTPHRSLQLATSSLTNSRPTTRSFRYSRFHRRVIDTVVPEDIRLLPDRWALRTSKLALEDNQPPER